jgi:hypothetical protein
MERDRNESAEGTAKDGKGQKTLPFRGEKSDEEQIESFSDALEIGPQRQNYFSRASGLVLPVLVSRV